LPSIAIFVSDSSKISETVEDLNKEKLSEYCQIEGFDGNLSNKENTVIVFSIDQIKGLEFEAVLFFDITTIDNIPDDLLLRYMYVGLSRAAYFFGIALPSKFGGSLSFLNNLLSRKKSWS
jgi:DNA helicase IV